jgi:hypothetical protein
MIGRIGLTPEAGRLSPRPNHAPTHVVMWAGTTIMSVVTLNPDVDIGLTPEAGRPAPRLNHALTCVVTCGERICRPFVVDILLHFSVSFSAFRGSFSPYFSVVSHSYESQVRQ